MPSPASDPPVITKRTDHEIHYDMPVRVMFPTMAGHTLHPWLRVTADCETGQVFCAAGVKVTRCQR